MANLAKPIDVINAINALTPEQIAIKVSSAVEDWHTNDSDDMHKRLESERIARLWQAIAEYREVPSELLY